MNQGYSIEKFYQVLGNITFRFASLDFLVTLLILRLVDFSKIKNRFPIDDRTTLKQKFKFLKNLDAEKTYNKKVFNEFNEFIDKGIHLSEKRNRYIHDLWSFNESLLKVGKIHRQTLAKVQEGLMETKNEQHTFEELSNFVNEILRMQKKTIEFFQKLPMENQLKNAIHAFKESNPDLKDLIEKQINKKSAISITNY